MTDYKVKLAGGRILARQCRAKCKATQQQCRCPAVRGYLVCRNHGARGGPRTEEGRARCGEAKLIHGRETRESRAQAVRSNKRIRAAKLAIQLLQTGQVDQVGEDLIWAIIGD